MGKEDHLANILDKKGTLIARIETEYIGKHSANKRLVLSIEIPNFMKAGVRGTNDIHDSTILNYFLGLEECYIVGYKKDKTKLTAIEIVENAIDYIGDTEKIRFGYKDRMRLWIADTEKPIVIYRDGSWDTLTTFYE